MPGLRLPVVVSLELLREPTLVTLRTHVVTYTHTTHYVMVNFGTLILFPLGSLPLPYLAVDYALHTTRLRLPLPIHTFCHRPGFSPLSMGPARLLPSHGSDGPLIHSVRCSYVCSHLPHVVQVLYIIPRGSPPTLLPLPVLTVHIADIIPRVLGCTFCRY